MSSAIHLLTRIEKEKYTDLVREYESGAWFKICSLDRFFEAKVSTATETFIKDPSDKNLLWLRTIENVAAFAKQDF